MNNALDIQLAFLHVTSDETLTNKRF